MPMLRQLKRLSRMVPGLMVSALVVLLLKLNTWLPVEHIATTQLMQWRGPVAWDSRVVMVSVDDKTLHQLGEFPLSRDYYANLLRLLAQEETSAVVFNLLFADSPSAGAAAVEGAVDARFAQAMAAHGLVVIGQTWGSTGAAIEPVPALKAAAIATGHLRVKIDPDGLTRWEEITVENVPALGIAAIQVYSLEKELVSIPTSLSELQINWPGPASELTTLSLIDVLNGEFPPGSLQGKIIVVGYGATTGRAHLRTPFDSRAPVPGGYLHAAVIDNLLGQRWLRSVPEKAVSLALLVGGSLLGGLLYRREVWLQLTAGGAIALGWLSICAMALRYDYLLPIAAPLMAVLMIVAWAVVLGRLQSSALLQVRTAFLSTISHEIRTPLNAIVNLSEMLQETPLDSRQREFTETLYNSSQILLALINDILDFSKIESGRLVLEKHPVRLSDTLERSLEMLAPGAAEKGLELAYSITPTTPVVILSDSVRLQQILLNLLSNAVKFTETGEISVQVQATALPQPRAPFPWRRLLRRRSPIKTDGPPRSESPSADRYEIRFAVRDTGIGIPHEQLSQLFEPFQQVSDSTTRQYGGTGLGLSISKRLSRYLGGDLWVRSCSGEGSTFYFTVQVEQAAGRQTIPDYLANLNGAQLLLIVSNQTRCEQLTWALQPLGVSLTRAISLSAALNLMQNHPTSWNGIILDEAVVAPQRQGYEPVMLADHLSRKLSTLRRAVGNHQLPVILLTTLKATAPDPLDRVTLLWKPIKQAALYQALRTICPATLIGLPAVATGIAAEESDRRACLNILIAEDNRTNQRVALRLLELLGYRADVVSSGTAALAALQRQRYEVILMDMRMPGADGMSTTRQIRQMAQHRDTWIIAMTANTTHRDRQCCFEAGMDDYLSKPIKREALALALQRCPAMQQAI